MAITRNFADVRTKNAVDKLLFGDDTYDVPEGRELRRSRTFEDFIFGSQPQPSPRPSPRPSPGSGNRVQRINLLSRPSPEMKARKIKFTKSEENLDWDDDNKFERGRKLSESRNDRGRKVSEIVQRSENLDWDEDNKFERGRKMFESRNVQGRKVSENKAEIVQRFEKNDTGVQKVENFYQKNAATPNERKFEQKSERKFDKQSRPKTTSAFLLDFQRKFVDQRLENLSRRDPRKRSGGPMTRTKSLSQLRDSPQPKHVSKTISTNFELEEFESESAELLEPNHPRFAPQKRRETKL